MLTSYTRKLSYFCTLGLQTGYIHYVKHDAAGQPETNYFLRSLLQL